MGYLVRTDRHKTLMVFHDDSDIVHLQRKKLLQLCMILVLVGFEENDLNKKNKIENNQ